MTRLLIAILFISTLSVAQVEGRYDSPGASTTSNIGGVPGVLTAVPNASVRICNYSLNPGLPCSPLAATFADATGVTPCPSISQVVLSGTNTCTSTTDFLGNFGFWATAGQYICQITASGVITTNQVCTASSGLSNINGVIYIDGIQYAKTQAGLVAAISAAQPFSGTVIIPSNTSITITSTLVVTSSVGLVLESGSSIVCNITTGTDCIQIGNKSAIIGRGNGVLPVVGCTNASGSLRSCITNADKTGAQEFFSVDGINIASTGPSSVSVALLDIEGVGVNSTVRDVVVAVCPSVCVNISNPSSSVGNSDMTFRNVWINGGSATNSTKPLAIAASTAGSAGGSINFYGGAIEHAGGTLPLATISGTTTTIGGQNVYTLENIGFYGTAFELNTATTADGVEVTNATAHFSNNRFSGTGGSFNNVIALITGGNITAEHLWLDGTNSTHLISDAPHGLTIGNNVYMPFYSSPADAYTANQYSQLGSVGFGGTGGGIFGPTGLLCSSSTPTISSGFGTGASVLNANGTCSFQINVGTGGTANSGTIGLPTAPHNWYCTCMDVTTNTSTVFACKQSSAGTSSTAGIGEYTAAGVAQAWTASDILYISCMGN